jgi:hypothetical protein
MSKSKPIKSKPDEESQSESLARRFAILVKEWEFCFSTLSDQLHASVSAAEQRLALRKHEIGRIKQVLSLLCPGEAVPTQLVVNWLDDHDDGDLQEWALNHSALPWAMGITLVEAAERIAREVHDNDDDDDDDEENR